MSKGSLVRGTDKASRQRYAEGWERIFAAKIPAPKVIPVSHGKKLKPYPCWVCLRCGSEARTVKWRPGLSTWHNGKCQVCGRDSGVTQPRDFGYPDFPGHVSMVGYRGKAHSRKPLAD